jgi:DNA-binding CsgD family transcriptional regulator
MRRSPYIGKVGTVPAQKVDLLLSTVADLAELDDPLPFPPQLLQRLDALVPSDWCGYTELDRVRQRRILGVGWSSGSGEPSTSAWEDHPYWRLRHQHPVCGYRERTNDWVSAHRASDFVTLREFRRREIWNELYRDDGTNYWLDIGLPTSHGITRVFCFGRQRRDFDESERLVLELLQPHLWRRHMAATAAADAAESLATLDGAQAGGVHDVVLCSGRGVIEFASPRSRRLLEMYFGRSNGRLPEPLLDAVSTASGPLVTNLDDRCLTIRTARTGTLLLLLLDERHTRIERLTRRQLQILERVALGETNDEIAAKLELSPATVGKHLENIYSRLGVHSRTAAAALLCRPD